MAGFANLVSCPSPKPYGSSITLQFNISHCKILLLYLSLLKPSRSCIPILGFYLLSKSFFHRKRILILLKQKWKKTGKKIRDAYLLCQTSISLFFSASDWSMHKEKTFTYIVATAHHFMWLGWNLSGDTIHSGCGKPKIKINTADCKKYWTPHTVLSYYYYWLHSTGSD